MGIHEWWDKAMGTFKSEPLRDLSEFKGKKLAVDFSIFLNLFAVTDADKLSMTSDPPYPGVDVLQALIRFHERLSKCVVPVYVFDGFAPNVKKMEKDKRKSERLSARKEWDKLVKRTREEEDFVPTDEEVKIATFARMKSKHPTALDHAAFFTWAKKEGIEC